MDISVCLNKMGTLNLKYLIFYAVFLIDKVPNFLTNHIFSIS